METVEWYRLQNQEIQDKTVANICNAIPVNTFCSQYNVARSIACRTGIRCGKEYRRSDVTDRLSALVC